MASALLLIEIDSSKAQIYLMSKFNKFYQLPSSYFIYTELKTFLFCGSTLKYSNKMTIRIKLTLDKIHDF